MTPDLPLSTGKGLEVTETSYEWHPKAVGHTGTLWSGKMNHGLHLVLTGSGVEMTGSVLSNPTKLLMPLAIESQELGPRFPLPFLQGL